MVSFGETRIDDVDGWIWGDLNRRLEIWFLRLRNRIGFESRKFVAGPYFGFRGLVGGRRDVD